MQYTSNCYTSHDLSIVSLAMTFNPIGEGGAVQFITARGSCRKLHALWLTVTGIGYPDTECITQHLLLSHDNCLQHLNLSDNDLSPESVGNILNVLLQRRSLRGLNYFCRTHTGPLSREPAWPHSSHIHTTVH